MADNEVGANAQPTDDHVMADEPTSSLAGERPQRRSQTYYQQHAWGDGPSYRTPTLTVGELIEQLRTFPPELPVIYRAPRYGVFGSGITTALDKATRETLPAQHVVEDQPERVCEETGETIPAERYEYDLTEWDGVVLL